MFSAPIAPARDPTGQLRSEASGFEDDAVIYHLSDK
jgi:hypothetical protein